jgi:hypothetical protein
MLEQNIPRQTFLKSDRSNIYQPGDLEVVSL